MLALATPTSTSSSDLLSGIELRPRDAHATLHALETAGHRLRAVGAPRAAFPDVYAVITRNVVTACREGRFGEPAWVFRLAGRFGELYLAALAPSVRGAQAPSGAWRAAFAARRGPSLPTLEAFLGINAHINVDLAQGIAANIADLGGASDPARMARYRRDHDAVNEILRESMPEILARLAVVHGCQLARLARIDPRVQRAVSVAVLALLADWRDRVWDDMMVLLTAPTPTAAAAQIARMDLRATLGARALTAVLTRPEPAVPERH